MRREIYTCRRCRAQNDFYTTSCPRCGVAASMAIGRPSPPVAASTPADLAADDADDVDAVSLEDIPELKVHRIRTNIRGLDYVLGEDNPGFGAPQCVLFAGSPGGGKSSLLMRAAAMMDERSQLYISTEEQAGKVRARGIRFGLDMTRMRILARKSDPLAIITDVGEILGCIARVNPRVVWIDSVNKLTDAANDTRDEERNLIKHVTRLREDQKRNGRLLVLISHMNKDGDIRGVKELQHDVDTVMLLERSKGTQYRVLHCPEKNRDAPTGISAMFLMTKTGLQEVEDNTVEERVAGATVRVYGEGEHAEAQRAALDKF